MTKIILQNSSDQYALSRRQIEAIIEILPNRYFEPILQIHVCSDQRNEEPFEYVKKTKTVLFSCLVKQKSREDVEQAVEALLVGLARIKAGSRFFHPLRERERKEYDEFVSQWRTRIVDALLG